MPLKLLASLSRPVARGLFVAGLLSLLGLAVPARAEDGAFVIPPPALDEKSGATTEKAVLAGGCFWGVQGVFQHVNGVKNAVSGYSGGDQTTADYGTVSAGRTGHAESVEVTFDPQIVSYGEILQVYFSVAHDPTQLNRQGPDHGSQYRSAIFYTNPDQKKIAEAYISQLDRTGIYGDPIVTTIEPITAFYPAEDYHQDFLTLNPDYPYIVFNDLPKIDNLQTIFPKLYRDKPSLVSQARS